MICEDSYNLESNTAATHSGSVLLFLDIYNSTRNHKETTKILRTFPDIFFSEEVRLYVTPIISRCMLSPRLPLIPRQSFS